MVCAPRKTNMTHEVFKPRYKQHIHMVAGNCGDTAPLSHTRSYRKHDARSNPRSNPMLLTGSVNKTFDSVVTTSWGDEARFDIFCQVLDT